jgi:hypothetical protein
MQLESQAESVLGDDIFEEARPLYITASQWSCEPPFHGAFRLSAREEHRQVQATDTTQSGMLPRRWDAGYRLGSSGADRRWANEMSEPAEAH